MVITMMVLAACSDDSGDADHGAASEVDIVWF
jgi:hypothetical protein